jgi:ABC-type transport system involved in multi-copper enzyme maturation permease subunit
MEALPKTVCLKSGNMSWLLRFEAMKFIRSKKTAAVLLLLMLALLGMVMYNARLDKAYWNRVSRDLSWERTLVNNESRKLEVQMEELLQGDFQDQDAYDKLNDHYKFYRMHNLFIYRQQLMIKFYLKGEASALERIELWLERDRHMLKKLQAGFTFLEENVDQVRQRLLVNEYMLAEGIEPLNSPHTMTAVNFLYQLMGYPWVLIPLIAMALLNIDIFSGEMEGGAYKILYAQPYSRRRVLAAKFLVHFTAGAALISLLVLLVFAGVAGLNGLGNPDYPCPYHGATYQGQKLAGSGDSLTFLPWRSYMGKVLPLYLLLLAFVTAFIGACSLILSSTANTVNILFSLVVLDFISRTLFPPEHAFNTLWPLAAADINGVLQGAFRLSALAYLLLLTILSALFLIGACFVLQRRDLTGGIGA